MQLLLKVPEILFTIYDVHILIYLAGQTENKTMPKYSFKGGIFFRQVAHTGVEHEKISVVDRIIGSTVHLLQGFTGRTGSSR